MASAVFLSTSYFKSPNFAVGSHDYEFCKICIFCSLVSFLKAC